MGGLTDWVSAWNVLHFSIFACVFRRAALQMPTVWEGLQPEERPAGAHGEAHRREALQVRGVLHQLHAEEQHEAAHEALTQLRWVSRRLPLADQWPITCCSVFLKNIFKDSLCQKYTSLYLLKKAFWKNCVAEHMLGGPECKAQVRWRCSCKIRVLCGKSVQEVWLNFFRGKSHF